ncbi:hypothetical protein Goshw_009202, partial [Gossypium schwendimanii]|nr:hypothetical protein [Gossypium schwendimanii]
GSEKLVFREVFTSVQDSGSLSGYIRTYVFVSIRVRLLTRELAMENEFLDKMEDNAVVRVWSEKTQLEKGDSLTEGYTLELWDFTYISVDKHFFRALAKIWNSTYSDFTFGEVDLVPTIAEYIVLLRFPKIQTVHLDTKKKVDVFALSIYGLMIFPRALGYIDEVVTDLFD